LKTFNHEGHEGSRRKTFSEITTARTLPGFFSTPSSRACQVFRYR
jgi:hypothetical protein